MGCDGVLHNCWLLPGSFISRGRRCSILIKMSSKPDSHHRAKLSRLQWSPTVQSTGTLFSSWASWAAGDWWRRPGMFEHLHRFCCNWFPVVVQRFNSVYCMTVLLVTAGQSGMHCQTTSQQFFFEPPGGFPLLIIIIITRQFIRCSIMAGVTIRAPNVVQTYFSCRCCQ